MTWPLDLAFVVPGLPFHGDTLRTESLGGSETAALCLARAMAAQGHHCVMFSDCGARAGTYDGVLYRPLSEASDYAVNAPHDVTVVQRMPEFFAARMNSRLNILWTHDLARGRQGDVFRSALWNCDKVAVLSEFMAQQYRDTYRVPDETLWRTRNGIDLAEFPALAVTDRTKLIFGARPERGLDVLLERIFPVLLQQRANLKLYVATYGNPVDHLRGFYGHIRTKIQSFGDSVVALPPMTKRAYYELLSSSGVYCYPTPSPTQAAFAEVSCITAMECQAAGLPIVTSRRGALPETIAPGAGVLLDGDPSSDAYVEAFCDAVLTYVRDDNAWHAASRAGQQHAATLDWAGVAEQWTEDLTRFIVERNDSPSRLVHQFLRRSDIMAAQHVLQAQPPDTPWVAKVQARLDTEWQFAASPTGLREQYETIGQTHTDVFAQVTAEPRFLLEEQWFIAHPEVQRVLDYGCAHGSYVVQLANRIGREWLGVDIDKHSIDWAEYNRVQRAQDPTAISFRVGIHDVDLSDVPPFDGLVAGEVLEHLPDPTVLDDLERWVKADGWVLITVPFGPWEWMSYKTYPHRCHLWEFDLHDLRDLFGKKKGLRISAVTVGKCEPLGEPLGWHVIEYRVDGTPTGTIDLARKARLQRPRETVSVVMIGGPEAAGTLGWALESVRDLADEIILGDCGLSDLAKTIATTHGARLVPASDPLQAGFETPRNEALAHATMDWVLWFDTDERLTGAHRVPQYLRRNQFTAYTIRQHNFSTDAPHEPMMPCRLFRRAPRADGVALRWFGMLHEHPEYSLNEGPGLTIILRDVHVAHLGYVDGNTQVARFYRNLPLLHKDTQVYPDRVLQKHFLCRDQMQMAQWEATESGGRLTPTIEARCREVIRLYREHFMGKGLYLNVDTLPYYGMALKVLGEGVEVVFSLSAAKDGAEPAEPIRARFASIEEAQAELTWRVAALMKPYASEYW